MILLDFLDGNVEFTPLEDMIIFTVETNGILWMAIHPKDNVGLVILRRDRAGVEKMTGLNCAIFLDRTTFYIKEKMMEEGIPFCNRRKAGISSIYWIFVE